MSRVYGLIERTHNSLRRLPTQNDFSSLKAYADQNALGFGGKPTTKHLILKRAPTMKQLHETLEKCNGAEQVDLVLQWAASSLFVDALDSNCILESFIRAGTGEQGGELSNYTKKLLLDSFASQGTRLGHDVATVVWYASILNLPDVVINSEKHISGVGWLDMATPTELEIMLVRSKRISPSIFSRVVEEAVRREYEKGNNVETVSTLGWRVIAHWSSELPDDIKENVLSVIIAFRYTDVGTLVRACAAAARCGSKELEQLLSLLPAAPSLSPFEAVLLSISSPDSDVFLHPPHTLPPHSLLPIVTSLICHHSLHMAAYLELIAADLADRIERGDGCEHVWSAANLLGRSPGTIAQ